MMRALSLFWIFLQIPFVSYVHIKLSCNCISYFHSITRFISYTIKHYTSFLVYLASFSLITNDLYSNTLPVSWSRHHMEMLSSKFTTSAPCEGNPLLIDSPNIVIDTTVIAWICFGTNGRSFFWWFATCPFQVSVTLVHYFNGNVILVLNICRSNPFADHLGGHGYLIKYSWPVVYTSASGWLIISMLHKNISNLLLWVQVCCLRVYTI